MIRSAAFPIRLSTLDAEVPFDTAEEAESALAFIAAAFEAEGYFVRFGDTWFTAATADDAQAGYIRMWFPTEAAA